MRFFAVFPALAAAMAVLSCSQPPPDAQQALVERGRRLFFEETFAGNGRTCATCHRAEANFSIDPAFIATLPPNDPLAIAAVAPPRAAAQDGSAAGRRSVDARAWVGERLEYDVKWGPVTLGKAALEVSGIDSVRGEEALHLEFLLDGGGFIYRLHNAWDSWVGLEDFASRRFIQDHDEGGKKYRNAYEIFPDSGYYRQEGVDTVAATVPQPLDDAAFFYFVRLIELEPGRRYELPNYFKPDRNPIVLEVVGRDTLDVPAGRFTTLVVQPTIKGGGIFKEGAEGRMWITDDPRHLVVQIKSKFFFGSITMRLTKLVEAGPREAEATK